MNKSATIDLATEAPTHTQALLDLVGGEARDSLLGIHKVLPRGTDVRRGDHHVIPRRI
ncbi:MULTISPECIES: hypothetical protein [Bradyrhizobium]|uniref:hypothetical protein n=1 Tax=Bradyrhizobium TaxID=374 RepID=UPI001FEDE29A|nr:MULTISPECIES: hypothetical protein [Bradyrhizobium]MDN4983471.1 hypothetical protein [Bradyrhizobium sp. WYCCWR 13022]